MPLTNRELTGFEQEQLVHLSEKILDYASDTEQKHFLESISFHDSIASVDKTEFERILNESDHIYKYMYALQKLINKIKDEKE